MIQASSLPVEVLERVCRSLEALGLRYAFLPSTPDETVKKATGVDKLTLWQEQKDITKKTEKYTITLDDIKYMNAKEKEQFKYYIKNSTIYYENLSGNIVYAIVPYSCEIVIGIPVSTDEKLMSNILNLLETID
jgi:hypothetical protein